MKAKQTSLRGLLGWLNRILTIPKESEQVWTSFSRDIYLMPMQPRLQVVFEKEAPHLFSELLIFTVSWVELCSQSLNPGFYKCKVTVLRDTDFNFEVTWSSLAPNLDTSYSYK